MVIDCGSRPDPVGAEQTLHDALKHQRFSSRDRPRLDGKPCTVRGRYRRLMKQRFPKKTYGQHWQIEVFLSMLKRNMGVAFRARSYRSQNCEIRLRIPTRNLAFLWCQNDVLYGAGHPQHMVYQLLSERSATDAGCSSTTFNGVRPLAECRLSCRSWCVEPGGSADESC